MTNKEKFADILADEIMELVENLDTLTESEIKGIAQSIAMHYAEALDALTGMLEVLADHDEMEEMECVKAARKVLRNTKGWKA